MLPSYPRRILLHQTETELTWLDLDTGTELVTPRPKATIKDAVHGFFDTVGLSAFWIEADIAECSIITKTLRARLFVTVHEDARCVQLDADLQICIADAVRARVLDVLANLSGRLHHHVKLEGDPARLLLSQTFWVGEWQPTPEIIDKNVRALLLAAEALHLVCAAVIADVIPLGKEIDLFNSAISRLGELHLSAPKEAA